MLAGIAVSKYGRPSLVVGIPASIPVSPSRTLVSGSDDSPTRAENQTFFMKLFLAYIEKLNMSVE
jgi:hypothetical protein